MRDSECLQNNVGVDKEQQNEEEKAHFTVCTSLT